jgi:antitoxin HicB
LEFQQEPEGGYTVTVPALPGCLTYGETLEEALTMIDDAISGWLVVAKQEGFDIPPQFAKLAKVS